VLVLSDPAFHHHIYIDILSAIVVGSKDTMKSWNEASSEAAPLIAPPHRRPAGDGRGRVCIRALGLTFATCMAVFGFDALFPDVKNWDPPIWREPAISEKPFEWSEVRSDFLLSFDEVTSAVIMCMVNFICFHPMPSVSLRLLRHGFFFFHVFYVMGINNTTLHNPSMCKYNATDATVDRCVGRVGIPQVLPWL
jgi:hypothetical protein